MTNPATDQALGEAFWRFSLALYEKPGAAERCLSLQDRAGWDVNLVLFSLWAGLRLGAPPPDDLAAAATLSSAWRAEAVAPLRRIRRRLKAGLEAPGAARLDAPSFREAVKALELSAEERQQRAIAPFAARAEGGAGPECAERLFFAFRAQRVEPQDTARTQTDAREREDWSALMTIAQQLGAAVGRPVDAAASGP